MSRMHLTQSRACVSCAPDEKCNRSRNTGSGDSTQKKSQIHEYFQKNLKLSLYMCLFMQQLKIASF